jgi:hypothetical protein
MTIGLNNNTNYSGNKIKLVDGAFRLPSKEGAVGAVLRKAMNPSTKETVELWEVPYKNLSAYIKNIVKEDTKFGAKVNIILEADKEYVLTFNPDNNFLLGIFKRLPNVEATKVIDFSATETPDEKGKMQTSLFMAQSGNNIAWKYTNTNPNGMPLSKKVTFNGKEMTDKTEQIEFLWKSAVIPFLENIENEKTKNAKEVNDFLKEDNLNTQNTDLQDQSDYENIPF